jgi:hypothetical protein
MAELGDFLSQADSTDDNVTVDMCDYGFVDECKDHKKLSGVLRLLRSGKEGFYPDLVKYTEDKLLTLLSPAEQQKILRLRSQASPIEIIEAEAGLTAWKKSIESTDKSLLKKESKIDSDKYLHNISPVDKNKRLPPPRSKG